MKVIYRITSIKSTNPSPIHQDIKDKLNEICLESFLEFFLDVKPEIIFLADHCNCQAMIRDLCVGYGYNYHIINTNHGINSAMIKSYEIAAESDDHILFQECDYFYKGKDGSIFLKAIEELGLVSPYDHRNFYKDRKLHSEDCKIKLVDDYHFRSTERNTMTWGCHSDLVKENLDMLKGHGYLDGQVWYDLKAKGYILYVPILSMATHMAKDWLAPGVNWEELWTLK